MNKSEAKKAKYWINARLVRPGDDYYSVDSDDGMVESFTDHADAVAFCQKSGETYFDNTN